MRSGEPWLIDNSFENTLVPTNHFHVSTVSLRLMGNSLENTPQRMAFDLTDTCPEPQVLGKRMKGVSYPLIRLP